jgi:tetratricopeptide (TPR) repeat protein
MNNSVGNSSDSATSPEKDAARDQRKKQADQMRQTSRRTELANSIRSILNQVQQENPIEQMQTLLTDGTSDQLKNYVLDLRRNLELDLKMKRLSQLTYSNGAAFLQFSQSFIDCKSQVDTLKHHLEQYRKPEKRDSLDGKEKKMLRDIVIQLRQALQNYSLLSSQAMKLFAKYCQGRRKDMGEEAALKHSVNFYLQFLEAPQRARIETQIKEKMEDMSLTKRIDALQKFIAIIVQISPSVRDAEVGRCIEMAHHFSSEDHLDDAVRELNKALEYSQSAEVYLELAKCWQLKGNTKEEINALKKAIQKEPEAVDPLLRLAQIQEEKGDVKAAIPFYEKVIEMRPHRFRLITHLAKITFDHHIWASAIEWLTCILKEKPNSKKTMIRLGVALVSTDEVERGLALLNGCRKKGIKDAMIDLYIGIAYHKQQHYSDAHTELLNAAAKWPENHEILYWLAQTGFDCGEYDVVESRCRSLLKTHGSDQDIIILHSKSLLKLGRTEESLELLQPLIEKDEASAGVMLEYGVGCLKANRPEDAYQVLKKAINIDPGNENIRENLGLACIQSGRFAESSEYMLTLA